MKFLLVTAIAISLSPALFAQPSEWERERSRLVKQIEADVRLTSREIGQKELDDSVMDAIATVRRHAFVPPRYRKHAYDNRPLPIGHGQTISQPYIVALMTDLLNVDEDDVVLEVGTGSGYQAAILSGLVDQVHTVEIIEPLAQQAKKRLDRLGFDNVSVTHADGYYGLPNEAPFDAIIVTAAAGRIPPPLVRQLRPGGRMVIPVGPTFSVQQLMLIEKDENGKVRTRQILPVRFVPLTGDH